MPMHRDRRVTLFRAKIGPPLWGRVSKPAGFVAVLAEATSLCCAPLLSSGLADAIREGQNGRKVL